MPFDLSAIEAQLAALGPIPGNLAELVARGAVPFSSLADTDAQLAALGSGDFQAPPARRPARRDPQSGEIALPEPVIRPKQPASGELNLDESTPRSGSYALEAEPSDLPEPDHFDSDAPSADVLPIAAPAGSRVEGAASAATTAFDPSPLSLFPEGNEEPPTARDALDSLPSLGKVSENVAPRKPKTPLADRDPDAEFDSLFEDATSPSGIPTRPLDEDAAAIEDLLSGLSSHKPPARGPLVSESAAAIEALFEVEEGDSTEVVETKSVFGEAGLPNLDPFPAEEELGSSEFEIVLDEAGAAKDIIRSDRPPKKNSPLPPANEDKRPSFLGRLFGKKDD